MEEFVREVLSRYTSFVSERQLYERWLDMRENSDVRDALVMTEMKITMIQSWFNLLNADERFVIEKHLLDELEWPRVAFSFTKKWDGEFTRTERSLAAYQANGLKKIISFVKGHGTLWRYLQRHEQINKQIIQAVVLAKGWLLKFFGNLQDSK